MSILQTKPKQLEERMLQFALNVIEVTRQTQKSPENQVIVNQLIKASTSIGANYVEANNASSKQDFRNKIFIAKKEAAESRYWLTLLNKTNDNIENDVLVNEVSELLMILQKIISTLKNGK